MVRAQYNTMQYNIKKKRTHNAPFRANQAPAATLLNMVFHSSRLPLRRILTVTSKPPKAAVIPPQLRPQRAALAFMRAVRPANSRQNDNCSCGAAAADCRTKRGISVKLPRKYPPTKPDANSNTTVKPISTPAAMKRPNQVKSS